MKLSKLLKLGEVNENLQAVFYLVILLFLGLFFIVESFIEKKNCGFGHTTGVIVMFGILVSYILHIFHNEVEGEQIMEDLQFEKDVFFDLILPLIIFPSGYNMRRKKFFQNIGTIMKFGFLGTVICFAVYSGMVYFAVSKELFKKYDAETGEQVPLNLGMYEILSVCSLLCSSDVIAAISMINYSD